jgi:hypothetical protein
MDSDPKTRRESKKSAKDKKKEVYSSKRVRQMLAFASKSKDKQQ